jgi:hypothetical protein
MSNPQPSPAALAAFDQTLAECSEYLDKLINAFRENAIGLDDDALLSALASAFYGKDPHFVADTLAIAVQRFARG